MSGHFQACKISPIPTNLKAVLLSMKIALVSLTSIPEPEMFAATDMSTVVTFDSNNTLSLLVEVMVGSHNPTSSE